MARPRAAYEDAALFMSEADSICELQCQHFGLAALPFTDTQAEADFFPSEQHLRALDFMGHALWTRTRLGVITAEAGTGKSLLVHRLQQSLDERMLVACVQHEHSDPRAFLLKVLQDFGFSLDSADRSDRRRLLESFLIHQASTGRLCLLIVENAQAMRPAVLEELRWLAQLEHDGRPVLKLLLLGRPALTLVLESPRMSQLLQGGSSRFTLSPFSEDQTAAYVAHRLRAAGCIDPDKVLAHPLMGMIHACSGGVPRNINLLCTQALLCAQRRGEAQVSAEALDEAIDTLGWQQRRQAAVVVDPLQQLALLEGGLPAPAALTISMQGVADREVVLGSERVLIGRGSEAEVRIDSVFISRFHALIVRDGRQHLLLDLGSTNGLLVNSRRVQRRVLRHRDLIQVGPARVTYINEAASQPAVDSGETLCLARPGMSSTSEPEQGALLAFGRLDWAG